MPPGRTQAEGRGILRSGVPLTGPVSGVPWDSAPYPARRPRGGGGPAPRRLVPGFATLCVAHTVPGALRPLTAPRGPTCDLDGPARGSAFVGSFGPSTTQWRELPYPGTRRPDRRPLERDPWS